VFEASQQQEGLQSRGLLRALNPFHHKHSAGLESILPVQNLFFINGTLLRQAYALPCLSVGMDVNRQLLGS